MRHVVPCVGRLCKPRTLREVVIATCNQSLAFVEKCLAVALKLLKHVLILAVKSFDLVKESLVGGGKQGALEIVVDSRLLDRQMRAIEKFLSLCGGLKFIVIVAR